MIVKRIFKYELEWALGLQTITMPQDAEVLTAQLQNGAIQVWAIVDQFAACEKRDFYLAFTGKPLPDEVQVAKYLSTIQDGNGLVWHVFYNS